MSTNLSNKIFIKILKFSPYSDSNEEALQGEVVGEEQIVEGEVERHVPQGAMKPCCLTYVVFLRANFTA